MGSMACTGCVATVGVAVSILVCTGDPPPGLETLADERPQLVPGTEDRALGLPPRDVTPPVPPSSSSSSSTPVPSSSSTFSILTSLLLGLAWLPPTPLSLSEISNIPPPPPPSLFPLSCLLDRLSTLGTLLLELLPVPCSLVLSSLNTPPSLDMTPSFQPSDTGELWSQEGTAPFLASD